MLKQQEEAKAGPVLVPKKTSANIGGLLKKKTEVSPKPGKSPLVALPAVPPPKLAKPEFTTNRMSARVVEMLLRDTMGLDVGDGKLKTETKIKARLAETGGVGPGRTTTSI